ncbi:MAG: hypothetical protein ABFD97_26025 [Syntrophobacter sp.]
MPVSKLRLPRKDLIPPLPDIAELARQLQARLEGLQDPTLRAEEIGITLGELDRIKLHADTLYRRLSSEGALDEPDAYWKYSEELDRFRHELLTGRDRELLAARRPEPEQTATRKPRQMPIPAFLAEKDDRQARNRERTDLPDTMNMAQLASYLGVSTQWAYQNYKRLAIPYAVIGCLRRFRKDKVDAWWEAQSRQ